MQPTARTDDATCTDRVTSRMDMRRAMTLIEAAQRGLDAVWAEVDASGTVTEGIAAAERSGWREAS